MDLDYAETISALRNRVAELEAEVQRWRDWDFRLDRRRIALARLAKAMIRFDDGDETVDVQRYLADVLATYDLPRPEHVTDPAPAQRCPIATWCKLPNGHTSTCSDRPLP